MSATPSAQHTDDQTLFDPRFLGQLRSLFFQLRKRRQLRRRGPQQTPSTGFTRQFKDHRQYARGDDYRAIDWRLFARLEKLFIRLFEEVQEFHVHILVDTSVSMVDPFPGKRVAALRMAAALSYLAMISQHRVSVMSMSDAVTRQTPPLKGPGHIRDLLQQLAAMRFDGTTDLDAALRTFRISTDRRGIVFLISDLFGRSLDQAQQAMTHAAHWPAETHVIHVMDPAELNPGLEGEVQLLDVETQEVRRFWLTRQDMDRYAESVTAFTQGLQKTCMGKGIDYMQWTTDQSFEDMFLSLLSRGSALAEA
jgi:uncharacterized protein (DUF58 family)